VFDQLSELVPGVGVPLNPLAGGLRKRRPIGGLDHGGGEQLADDRRPLRHAVGRDRPGSFGVSSGSLTPVVGQSEQSRAVMCGPPHVIHRGGLTER